MLDLRKGLLLGAAAMVAAMVMAVSGGSAFAAEKEAKPAKAAKAAKEVKKAVELTVSGVIGVEKGEKGELKVVTLKTDDGKTYKLVLDGKAKTLAKKFDGKKVEIIGVEEQKGTEEAPDVFLKVKKFKSLEEPAAKPAKEPKAPKAPKAPEKKEGEE